MKIVAVGATEIIPSYFWTEFQADADFEVKWAVASYFWAVFKHFLGQNFGQNFVLFFLVRVTLGSLTILDRSCGW